MKFVSLHHHTSHSHGDGHGLPSDHAARVKELGMAGFALTEHGNTSSHVQHEQACLELGLKPLFGLEAYVSQPGERRKFHQTILAENEEGYRNLCHLTSESWEDFHQFPTVHPSQLFDPEATKGLIILSGCADSMLSCAIAGGKGFGDPLTEEEIDNLTEDEVRLRTARGAKVAKKFQDTFGDRYFIEVQPFHGYFRTRFLNRVLVEIAETLGIPIVGTADVHYPHEADWQVQRLSNAIRWHRTVEELAEGRDYAASPCTLPESDEEYLSWLTTAGLSREQAEVALDNTQVIFERCSVTLPKTPPVRYSESDGTSEHAAALLRNAIADGISWRIDSNPRFAERWERDRQLYAERIRKELSTILPKDFADYFLVNQQVISWAKDNGVAVGPGRGSAASSLVCYLLRITEIDPMEFPEMVFERFLDPSRSDDPDIDTDYADEDRYKVFEFMRGVYGVSNVGNLGNFNRYRGKSAVKAAGKALKVPIPEVEAFAEMITETPFGDPREFNTIEDAEEAFPEAKKIMEKHPELRLAREIEGDMSNLGIHAAGMVVSNLPISDTCSIYKRTKSNGDESEVIAYDKRDAGYLRMLKLDCLGLKTMQIVSDTIEMVDSPDLTLETLYALPFTDEKTLKAFGEDDLTGIFQFEGRTTRGIVKDIYLGKDKYPDFRNLADINALSRPGSLTSGMTGRYVKVENGDDVQKIHPAVDEVLSQTNGCLVYQEQVMKIGKVFGGLADDEIGRLRKIIGAKQMGGAFESFWEKFKSGAERLHGAPEALSRQVWDFMAASASYLFNVSHAISYAAVAYWTMYLKVHYPAEFYVASLRSASKKGKVKGKADPELLLLKDAVQHGLTVSPPHPATSGFSWTVSEDRTGVMAGFTQIDGIGQTVGRALTENQSESCTWDDHVSNVKGFGAKAKEKAEALASKPDPFDIDLTSSAILTVERKIFENETDLGQPDCSGATIPSKDGQPVAFLGHVVSVKIIDVIGEMRQRENMTTEEVKSTLKNPELATKAKIVCADLSSTEVHVNISRFNYPMMKDEIAEIDPKKVFLVHATGTAANYVGPAVQADTITAIEMED